MKKRLFATLCALAMVIALIPSVLASAEGTKIKYENTELYYTKYDDHCEISDCDTSAVSVTIPNEIENLSVTAIANFAFSSCNNLKNVIIPDSVTSIGKFAFEDCTQITEITLPKSVETLENRAFEGCTALKDIKILNDNMSNLSCTAFDDSGYYNDEKNWMDGVLYVSTYAITAKSSDVGEIEIKDGTKVIVGYAFFENTSIIGVTFPSSLTRIGEHAFRECTGLKSVKFPTSNPLTVEEYAFYHCDGLEYVKIPENVTLDGKYVFGYCKGIKYVEINGTTIPDRTFYENTNLKELDIGEKVESIGEYAFINSAITELSIPKSVKSIGMYAFCDNPIQKVNYAGTKEEWNNVTISIGNELGVVKCNHDQKSFTFTGNRNIEGCTVILAVYKEDGQGNSQLVDCKTAVYSGTPILFTTTSTDYTSAKVMVWKDLETLEPVTEVEVVDLIKKAEN